jgi:hypothetical protein
VKAGTLRCGHLAARFPGCLGWRLTRWCRPLGPRSCSVDHRGCFRGRSLLRQPLRWAAGPAVPCLRLCRLPRTVQLSTPAVKQPGSASNHPLRPGAPAAAVAGAPFIKFYAGAPLVGKSAWLAVGWLLACLLAGSHASIPAPPGPPPPGGAAHPCRLAPQMACGTARCAWWTSSAAPSQQRCTRCSSTLPTWWCRVRRRRARPAPPSRGSALACLTHCCLCGPVELAGA